MHTRIPTITVAHTRRNQKQQPDGRGDLTGYPADLFGEYALCYQLVRKPILKEPSCARQRYCSRLASSCWHQLSTCSCQSGWSEPAGRDPSQRDTAGAQWHAIANQLPGAGLCRRTLSRTEVSGPRRYHQIRRNKSALSCNSCTVRARVRWPMHSMSHSPTTRRMSVTR
jgi:hypothetical protein